jgi:hypothetical protein
VKLPAHVLFRKELSLMLWRPQGILDEALVNEMVAFIDAAEERGKAFNRFADLSALEAVDLNFNFVLPHRLAPASRLCAAFAGQIRFLCTSQATAHYAKLHAMLTDLSPLDVALFTDRAAAAKWLGVPLEALSA